MENTLNTTEIPNNENNFDDRAMASYMVSERLQSMRMEQQEKVLNDLFSVVTQLTGEISALKNEISSLKGQDNQQQESISQINPQQENANSGGALENLYSQLQLNNQLNMPQQQ